MISIKDHEFINAIIANAKDGEGFDLDLLKRELDEITCNNIREELIKIINQIIDDECEIKTEIIKRLKNKKSDLSLTEDSTWDDIIDSIKDL